MQGVCSPASHFSEFEKSKGEEGGRTVRRTDMPERGVFAGLCNCAGLIGVERKTIYFFFYLVPWRTGEKGDGKRLEREWVWAKQWLDEKKRAKNSGWCAYTVQGVRRSAVIKWLQKTARAAQEAAIKVRRQRE